MNMVRPVRNITLLQGFLLAILSRRGEATFYSLKRDFALNPGGIAHALSALAETGLVTRSQQTGRSQAYRLTAVGERALRSQWRTLVSETVSDRDAAVRMAWLAAVMDLGASPSLLRTGAEKVRGEARDVMPAVRTKDGKHRGDEFYFVVKATVRHYERRALAKALEQLADHLEEVSEP